MSAIVEVPNKRLSPSVVRNIARKNWGLTWEQMKGMDVHHFLPRCEGGKDIPEHLYICSREMHRTGWHNDAWFMKNLNNASLKNKGKKHSKDTCKKKSDSLKGRSFGHKYEGGEKHPNNKKVCINGKIYACQQEAANDIKITIQGLSYRMKNWGPERGYEYVQ
jgi:hypothetical protein